MSRASGPVLLREPAGLAVGLALKEPAPPHRVRVSPGVGSPAPLASEEGSGTRPYRCKVRGSVQEPSADCKHLLTNTSRMAQTQPVTMGRVPGSRVAMLCACCALLLIAAPASGSVTSGGGYSYVV